MVDTGDRVGYSARFIRSVQAHELADRRGTVVEIRRRGRTTVARVRWDDCPDEVTGALVQNLAVPGSARFALNDYRGAVG